MSGDDKKLWLDMHSRECPGIAIGHFEQRVRDAYALLLVSKTGENGGYQIVVLSNGSDGYSVRLLDHAEAGSLDSGLVISKERPGTYSDFETSKSIHLTLDGLNVEWLEKSSVLYYWSNGEYRSIQTSD